MKEYSIEDFENLSVERNERSKYGEVWKLFKERSEGNIWNMEVINDEIRKICVEVDSDLMDKEFSGSIIYGWINRKVRRENKKGVMVGSILKRYDGRICVYSFIY